MVDMHFLGYNTTWILIIFFNFVEDTILSDGVAQISNKSKKNRRIDEESQVLNAQLFVSTISIPMDLIKILFVLLLVILSSSIFHTILFENKLQMPESVCRLS